MRDDCYVDKTTADILGDYVAAAPLLLTHGRSAGTALQEKAVNW